MSLIAGLIISAIVGAVASAASAGINYASQKQTNETNVALQREANAQNQYNIEHAHQIEMNDLKEAGLNPVLTATGGSGAPLVSMNSPRTQAPQMDLSGIGSALQIVPHMLMMKELSQARNDTLVAIANSNNATKSANAVLRNETLDRLYQRKAESLSKHPEVLKSKVHSAKEADELSDKDIQELLKIIKNR